MKDKTTILGIFLITFSLISTLYIYFPILRQEYTFRFHLPSITSPVSPDFGLIINKLGLNEPVAPQVDPSNPSLYLPILNHSLAHSNSSALPGTPGTVYIFGHSSDNPFSITRYNTSFYLLHKLTPGDLITVFYLNQPYYYKVRQLATVSPSQTQFLGQSPTPQLILQTCTPIGTSLKRLLVFADPLPSPTP